MLENYNMSIKANETKVIIKRTGQIGTVVGIVDSGCGSYSLRVRVPSRYNDGVHYVGTYDLTDIIFKKENITHARPNSDSFSLPNIKAVYFNDPLTCVIWEDGVKTFVKNVDGELKYDKEKALAMAISKRAFGNKYNYYKIFEKHHAVKERIPSVDKPSHVDYNSTYLNRLTNNEYAITTKRKTYDTNEAIDAIKTSIKKDE